MQSYFPFNPTLSALLIWVHIAKLGVLAHGDNRHNPIDRTGNHTVDKESFWIEGCTPEQEKAISDTMPEALHLLRGARNMTWNGMAAMDYLATHTRGKWKYWDRAAGTIVDVAYQTLLQWKDWPHIMFSCEREDEDQKGKMECDDYKDSCPILVKYYEGQDRWNKHAHGNMIFCNRWFSYGTLPAALHQGMWCQANDFERSKGKIFDLSYYENRALHIVHAVFHLREITSYLWYDRTTTRGKLALLPEWPHHAQIYSNADRPDQGSKLPVFTPWQAKQLATNGPDERWEDKEGWSWAYAGALGSATNWALYTLAEFLTEHLRDYPAGPYIAMRSKDGLWNTKKMCDEYPGFPPAAELELLKKLDLIQSDVPSTKRRMRA